MAAKGNGRNLRGWARRKSRARSFLYETQPQTAPRVTSSWFFEGQPVGDAGGLGTATGIAAVTYSSAGSAAGTSSALAVGWPPNIAIGSSQIVQSLYSQNPIEPIGTWSTNLDASTVDTATDTITATNHGFRLNTCPGPFRFTTTGALPSPLAVDTDYWLIVPTQDTFKVATTGQNAAAGTAINLTTTGSGTHTLVRTIDTRTSSALITAVARGVWSTDGSATTDNKSNNYSDFDVERAYDSFPGSKVRMRVDLSATCGTAHTITATMGDLGGSGDEVTASIVEVIGAQYLIASARNETAIGSASITTPAVTSTDEALFLVYLWGNGPVGQDHTWSAVDSNWTKITNASAEQDTHPNGYIQCAVFWRKYSTAQTALTASFSGTSLEGAQAWVFVLQATNPSPAAGSAAGSGTATAASVTLSTGTGSAAGTGTASGAAASGDGAGAASGTGTATGTGTAIYSSAGSASGTSTPAAVGASTAAASGAASGTSTPAAVGAATAAGAGAAAGTGSAAAVGAATSAAAGVSAGTSTPTAVGASTAAGAGATAGTSSASAAGASTAAGQGVAAGTATPTAAGASTAAGAGAASGLGSAAGAGASVAAGAGAAVGTSDASASADAGIAVGAASGSGTAGATGTAITSAAGDAAGSSSAAGAGASTASAAGVAAGSSSATATGAATSAATSAAAGSGSAAATSTAIVGAAGAAAGTSTATAAAGAAEPLPSTIGATRATARATAIRTTSTAAATRTTARATAERTT